MNERRKTGSLPVYDVMPRWGFGGLNLAWTDPKMSLSAQLSRSFPLHFAGIKKAYQCSWCSHPVSYMDDHIATENVLV